MSFSVLSTIESIPDLQELKVNSVRSREVKNLAERVKQLCHLEVNREKFAVLSAALAEVISSMGSDEPSHPYPSIIMQSKDVDNFPHSI